jgi:purine catabolism regulator
MYPTVSDVLALPVMRQGEARVVAGTGGLGNRVRWVHTSEVADIAHLLRGGELVLTTGIALPADPDGLARYVDELAKVGVAGLVIELVRRWQDALPAALSAAADRHGLPLVTLSRETRFVAVSEAVIALILDAQIAELRAAEQVHETFTTLTVSGAEPAEILREVAGTSGLPVVLETLAHDVLGYDAAGRDPAELLVDWEERSRAVELPGRTSYADEAGWLVTIVGARGDDWGRLVLLSPEPPPHRLVVVAERAASALAVHRLVARDRDSLERQSHRTLLTDLLAPGPPPADLPARAAALGVPLDGRHLVGVAIRPRTTPEVSGTASAAGPPALATQEVLRDLAEATALAARRARVRALVGVVDDASVRALVTVPARANVDASLHRMALQVQAAGASTAGALGGLPVVVAAGTTVPVGGLTDRLAAARRSLSEAAHVASAALRAHPPATGPATDAAAGAAAAPAAVSSNGQGGQATARPFHRLADVRLRGLLHLLRDDERVAAFVDRELGPLLARDAATGGRLVDVLRGYCEHGGNKSAAAAAAHTSRTAYYQQLARVEQVLGVRLDDPESMLSLHVALLARDAAGPDVP